MSVLKQTFCVLSCNTFIVNSAWIPIHLVSRACLYYPIQRTYDANWICTCCMLIKESSHNDIEIVSNFLNKSMVS